MFSNICSGLGDIAQQPHHLVQRFNRLNRSTMNSIDHSLGGKFSIRSVLRLLCQELNFAQPIAQIIV